MNGEGANATQDQTRGSMVGRRWSIPIPTFHDPLYLPGGDRGQDGYLYTVARKGINTMPAYGHALGSRDTWAVVAYIRALQASHLGTPEDVPDGISIGSPPPPPPPQTETTTPDAATEQTEAQQ